MQDWVSIRWTRATGLSVALALAVSAFSGSSGMAWMSLGWVILAISVCMWLDRRSDPVPALALVPSAAFTRSTVL